MAELSCRDSASYWSLKAVNIRDGRDESDGFLTGESQEEERIR